MSFTTDNGASAKSSYVPPYSLPSTSELAVGDDWTTVKDRKEKKKIQNRVAQRTYRQRMKSRLTELQAKINYHDRNMGLSTEEEKNTATPAGRVRNSLTESQVLPPTVTAESSLSKLPEKENVQPQVMQHNLPNMSEPAMDNGEKTGFLRHGSHINASHINPTHMNGSHINAPSTVQPFSQPQFLYREEGPDRNGKAYDMLLMDCMRLPKEPRSRPNNQQEDTNFTQLNSQRDSVIMSPQVMDRAAHTNGASVLTPEESDTRDHFFDMPIDSWKSNTLSPTMGQTPFPLDTPNSTAQPSVSGLAHMTTATALDSDCDISALSAKNASLEERFEFIMECVVAIGVDNFDKLVTTYYIDTFEESSPLANEQRLSRNRRLPKVIADLFCATKQWSTWERWGFYEEILKTTETMLISENSRARSSMDAGIAPLIEAQNSANTTQADQAILALKRKIPNELPNLWALMMALTASNRAVWQQDCSSTALATILLLHCAGRIPNEQLLDLIGACL